ncbi:hypothetical protein H5410_004901 [Solanum commersonii]|uniref:Uncharacterized protein n=1 Tax=Solanum commersonii TaxID=4109 RepID=A0A9J6A5W2_SOLCO|nr:hypothetical protein H5410_004901 [Solanum commersonii]
MIYIHFKRVYDLESSTPTSNFLELEVFKSSRIVDALGDHPFVLLHQLSAFAFNIFAFWIIGRYNSSSRNYSAMRLNTVELWARLRLFGDLPNALGDPQAFFSLSFQPICSFLPSSVDALPQTPNT